MSVIFICYSHNDTAGHAGRVVDALRPAYPSEQIFIDVAAVKGGQVWSDKIHRATNECLVMFCLIGLYWGPERLFNENDVVRREISAVLSRRGVVVPLLFDHGKLPQKDTLPLECQELLTRQTITFDPTDLFNYESQLKRLPSVTQNLIEEQYTLGVSNAQVEIEFCVRSNRGTREAKVYIDNRHVMSLELSGEKKVGIKVSVGHHEIEVSYFWANPASRSMEWHGWESMGKYSNFFEAGKYTALIERYQPPFFVGWDRMTFHQPIKQS